MPTTTKTKKPRTPTSRAEQKALLKLSPFELKDKLMALAAETESTVAALRQQAVQYVAAPTPKRPAALEPGAVGYSILANHVVLPPAPLAALDLHSLAIDDNGAVASAGGARVAHLTLDPKLQIFVNKLLAKHKLPQASVVMIDPATGKVLAYASRDNSGAVKDLNVEATAPSASVTSTAASRSGEP